MYYILFEHFTKRNPFLCLQKSLKYKVASSHDSKEYYQKYRPQTMFERERDVIMEALPAEEISTDISIPENGEEMREIGKQDFQYFEFSLVKRKANVM